MKKTFSKVAAVLLAVILLIPCATAGAVFAEDEGPDTSYVDALTVKESDHVRIICWGDSLTEGYGVEKGNSYSDFLRKLVDEGVEVINYGVSSELAYHVAIRQGGEPFYVTPVTIPADCTPVGVSFVDYEGNPAELGFYPRNYHSEWSAQDSINPFYIAGIKGTLDYDKPSDTYTFTRAEAGEEKTITRLTQCVTHAMEDRCSKDILVIWTGSNDYGPFGPCDLEAIIAYQRAMIAFAGVGERYVVCDFTAERMVSPIVEINAAMAAEYGDHIVKVRDYLRSDAFADAGLEPTAEDRAAIDAGQIPPTMLVSDGLHFSIPANKVIGKLLYEKLSSLGLLSHTHQWGEWKVIVPATTLADGLEERKCSVCGAVEQRKINRHIKPHVYYDVPDNGWFTNGVLYCSENGYMTGTDQNHFSPYANFTRAMFVVVLSKIAGADLKGIKGTSFKDVSIGSWYGKQVEWAKQNDYASGLGGGLFGPEQPVTREQLAMFLYKYASKNGKDVSKKADISGFPDASDVSGYAKTAISWAVGAGMISGVSDGNVTRLVPGGHANRAQVALITQKFVQNVVEK